MGFRGPGITQIQCQAWLTLKNKTSGDPLRILLTSSSSMDPGLAYVLLSSTSASRDLDKDYGCICT